MYRTFLIAAALAIPSAASAASAAAAQPGNLQIPSELTDPKFVERIAGMTDALSKALLDLPVGELEAAVEGRAATEADRRRKVRDVARISDREIQQQIAAARPRVEAAMGAFAKALPEMTRSLSDMAERIERAAANVPQPGYPKQ